MLNIGWFSTARGDSSRKLLQATFECIQRKQLQSNIDFVFCSRDPGESNKTDLFLQLVREYGIPLICLSVKKFASSYQTQVAASGVELPEWRLGYDRQVMEKLADFSPDICVMAGYMLIVGPEMCSKYNMINLHPALPDGPKGTWQEVIWTLMELRATESGVMLHLVTPDLDRGPVITYCKFAITGPAFDELWLKMDCESIKRIRSEQGEGNELFKMIRQAGFIREVPLIINTLKAFSEGRISIGKDKLLRDDIGRIIHGYDLTDEIDAAVTNQSIPDK